MRRQLLILVLLLPVVPMFSMVWLTAGCSNSTESAAPPDEATRTATKAPANVSPPSYRQEVANAMKAKEYEVAETLLTAWIAIEPNEFDAVSARAALRLMQGDSQGARLDYDRCVAIDGDKGRQVLQLTASQAMWQARELDTKKEHKRALSVYDALIDLFPDSGMTYHERGAVKISLGLLDGAIDDLNKAIVFDEGNNAAGDSFTLRARAKRMMGDHIGAKADEEKADAQRALLRNSDISIGSPTAPPHPPQPPPRLPPQSRATSP